MHMQFFLIRFDFRLGECSYDVRFACLQHTLAWLGDSEPFIPFKCFYTSKIVILAIHPHQELNK